MTLNLFFVWIRDCRTEWEKLRIGPVWKQYKPRYFWDAQNHQLTVNWRKPSPWFCSRQPSSCVGGLELIWHLCNKGYDLGHSSFILAGLLPACLHRQLPPIADKREKRWRKRENQSEGERERGGRGGREKGSNCAVFFPSAQGHVLIRNWGEAVVFHRWHSGNKASVLAETCYVAVTLKAKWRNQSHLWGEYENDRSYILEVSLCLY